MNDWRLQGQEKFLMGKTFSRKKYTKYRDNWEHDHCEFCGKKFSEQIEDTHEGYVTTDGYHWVCDICFNDFKDKFNWKTQMVKNGKRGQEPFI